MAFFDHNIELKDDKPSNIIKVIGVGGGGSNAVRHMYEMKIQDVDFVVCNTDLQALNDNSVPTKLQLGAILTEGLGAGTEPEQGRLAAEESDSDYSVVGRRHQDGIYHRRYGWWYRYWGSTCYC
jgi:cell division protein FtsZ